jgi:hypothetical protein
MATCSSQAVYAAVFFLASNFNQSRRIEPSERQQENLMEQDRNTGHTTISFEELVYSNSLMVEAVVEVLMDKGLVTREELLERVKRIKEQAALGRKPPQ